MGEARADSPRPRVSGARSSRACLSSGWFPQRFGDLCARLIDQNPQDWRTRLALSRHLAADGRHRKAFELLLDALPHNPHGTGDPHEVWKALLALDLDQALVRRCIELTRSAVFYLDPHVCLHCRYRSTELLWRARSATNGIPSSRSACRRPRFGGGEVGDKRVAQPGGWVDMKRVGLTGGIATGKSVVRAELERLGADHRRRRRRP